MFAGIKKPASKPTVGTTQSDTIAKAKAKAALEAAKAKKQSVSAQGQKQSDAMAHEKAKAALEAAKAKKQSVSAIPRPRPTVGTPQSVSAQGQKRLDGSAPPKPAAPAAPMKCGGKVKKYARGGGIEVRGKTKGRII